MEEDIVWICNTQGQVRNVFTVL